MAKIASVFNIPILALFGKYKQIVVIKLKFESMLVLVRVSSAYH